MRPALAGIKAPDTGPPDDVIRSYLAPQEEILAFSARQVEEPAITREETTEGEGEEGAEAESDEGDEGDGIAPEAEAEEEAGGNQ